MSYFINPQQAITAETPFAGVGAMAKAEIVAREVTDSITLEAINPKFLNISLFNFYQKN